MSNRWWSSLSELSQPEWRPSIEAALEIDFRENSTESERIPSQKTLEGVGLRFSARFVHWWQIRGKKPARMVAEWQENSVLEGHVQTEQSALDPEWIRDPANKLLRLIELAVAQQQPIWVEGDANAGLTPEITLFQANRPRMFAWIVVSRNQRNVLEVGLDGDRNRVSGDDRERYLRAMHELREELSRKVSEPFVRAPRKLILPEGAVAHPRADQTAETSIGAIVELASILNAVRAETIRRIESKLASLEGARLDSLQANQSLAKSLHQLLDGHGFRLRCPECGEPAIMRCLAAGNSATGSFVFDHYLSQGRTFHGGRSSIPKLAVIAKPARYDTSR